MLDLYYQGQTKEIYESGKPKRQRNSVLSRPGSGPRSSIAINSRRDGLSMQRWPEYPGTCFLNILDIMYLINVIDHAICRKQFGRRTISSIRCWRLAGSRRKGEESTQEQVIRNRNQRRRKLCWQNNHRLLNVLLLRVLALQENSLIAIFFSWPALPLDLTFCPGTYILAGR